ncbi:MAG: hypothetical protein JWM12_363 [Ilumatobacteraceae bacterium]|jgi:hypothetical protein|nr:hypothetical protein [Ilumatobacteraceae bacterium]
MTVRVLEHVVRRAALAVRVHDLATGAAISDGISVTTWAHGRPDVRWRTRSLTADGVGGFTRLSGLAAYEDGSTPRDEWFVVPVQHPSLLFVVRVDDATGDHLPVLETVSVPVASPVELGLPRRPTAALPAGSLAVIATVVTEDHRPAAWAVVEVSVGGYSTGGVADARGVVVVPLARAVAATSVGTDASGPIWQVTVRARFRAADQVVVPGAAPEDPPSLRSLFDQRAALVDDGGNFVASLQRDLTTGGPLVVASLAAPSPSVLVVRPAP